MLRVTVHEEDTSCRLELAGIYILLKFKYLFLFACVLAEQSGLPVPSAPALVMAGALSSERKIWFFGAFVMSISASIIAVSGWFLVGRKFCSRVLNRANRMSLHPSNSIRSARNLFARQGAPLLLVAKFAPGVSLLAPPLAGQSGMRFGIFLLLDGLGSALWVGASLAAGRYFGDLLEYNPILNWASHYLTALATIAVAAFLLTRIHHRRLMMRQLLAYRMEPEQLCQKLEAGEPVFIVGLRRSLEFLTDPFTLPSPHRFSSEELTAHLNKIPRDRDIVLYRTCPSETTAATTAAILKRLGIERVRPLRGGFDRWKRLGYRLERAPPAMPFTHSRQSAREAQDRILPGSLWQEVTQDGRRQCCGTNGFGQLLKSK